uniref:Mannosyltransferase n=1 Tax=Heterorhabditis bacteriophora TaxID=37862 RepID=A0A1I7X4Z6_HETBA
MLSVSVMSSFHLWLLFASWFVPDEVYQSSEVAHHVVYSTGHLSWEWAHSLRSVIHPLLIVFVRLLGMDSQVVVANAPRVIHALLFSIGDIAFAKLCRRLLPTKEGAIYSTLTYVSCWFVFYCAPRTLSNSLEAAVTLIALTWYPFEGAHYKGLVWPYMSLGMITITIRPTAALIWLVLGAVHLIKHTNPLRFMICTVLPAILPVFVTVIILDSVAYSYPTCTMWNFLSFNVLKGGSAHFGVHPWHWYFTMGLTSVLTVQLVPIILGIFSPQRPGALLLCTAVFYIGFHSFLPHKEQRFLLPIIPFLCVYAGPFFTNRRHYSFMKTVMKMMVIVNIIIAAYTGLRHQVGPYNAADSILKLAKPNASIIALMPCYSIPGHSYFHNHLFSIRQLDCSPDLSGNGIMDEADTFHKDPATWLDLNWPEIENYSYILIYQKMFNRVSEMFGEHEFITCDNVFHADFLTSTRQDHYILNNSAVFYLLLLLWLNYINLI